MNKLNIIIDKRIYFWGMIIGVSLASALIIMVSVALLGLIPENYRHSPSGFEFHYPTIINYPAFWILTVLICVAIGLYMNNDEKIKLLEQQVSYFESKAKILKRRIKKSKRGYSGDILMNSMRDEIKVRSKSSRLANINKQLLSLRKEIEKRYMLKNYGAEKWKAIVEKIKK
jgi:predicted RND superfamily exporter protein